MDAVVAHRWERRAADEWRRLWGVPELHVFETVGSTNDVLSIRAEAGAPAGATALADAQSAGRGRRGKAWTPAPGTSLLLSMLLRATPDSAEAPFSIRLGLAAARAIERAAAVEVRLKWPNDLLVDGRKVGGILCEGGWGPGSHRFVVAGIGINVDQRDEDWPEDLAGRATSLAARSGEDVDRAALAGGLVAAWLPLAEWARGGLTAAELEELAQRDALRGRMVTVDGGPTGIADEIAPDGALLVRVGTAVHRVISGSVTRLDDAGEGA